MSDAPLSLLGTERRSILVEVNLLSLLNKTQRHGPRVGVMVSDRSVAMAVVRRAIGQRPVVEHCAVHACEGNESIEQLLRRTIAKLGVARASVFAVASAEDYQLVQVEAPEVQPAELRAAIRWRLRDVIDFHIDDAVVDVFEIPDQSRRAQAKMLFAVAARSARVQRMVSAIAPLARHFDVIDIPELCVRNVARVLPQDRRRGDFRAGRYLCAPQSHTTKPCSILLAPSSNTAGSTSNASIPGAIVHRCRFPRLKLPPSLTITKVLQQIRTQNWYWPAVRKPNIGFSVPRKNLRILVTPGRRKPPS